VTGPRVEGPRATLRVAHTHPPSGFTGGSLTPRMGITPSRRRLAASPSPWIVRVSRRNEQRSSLVPRPVEEQIASAKRAPPASAGEGGQEPASGAPAHDVLRLDGGDAVPPESKPAAERPPANLDRRQNCRASPPAAEQPASLPTAERPSYSTGGRAAELLHRPQNSRATRPMAERPSHSTGGRTAGHLHPPQNCREPQPTRSQPAPISAVNSEQGLITAPG
jgi:hypothetical protein